MKIYEVVGEDINSKSGLTQTQKDAIGGRGKFKQSRRFISKPMGPARMGRMGGSGHAIGRSIASGGKGASSSTLSAIGRSMRL